MIDIAVMKNKWEYDSIYGLFGLDRHDLAASDAELLVHLPSVFLLAFDQLPHSA